MFPTELKHTLSVVVCGEGRKEQSPAHSSIRIPCYLVKAALTDDYADAMLPMFSIGIDTTLVLTPILGCRAQQLADFCAILAAINL